MCQREVQPMLRPHTKPLPPRNPAWTALDMAERADYLNRLGDAIAARTQDLARLEAIDTGNTIGKMVADVEKAVERIRLGRRDWVMELKGETIPSTTAGLHFTLRTPYGVVGRIIPFNHPFGFAASPPGQRNHPRQHDHHQTLRNQPAVCLCAR